MQFVAKYRSGETRVINLTIDFFTFTELSVAKRALDLAYSFATDVFDIKVWREEVLVYDKFDRAMAPERYTKKNKYIDEKDIKKQLRKEFKGKNPKLITFDKINDLSN